MPTKNEPRLTNEQLHACAATLALMRQLGPEHFNMDHWFVDLPDAEESTTDGSLCDPGNPCGTAACLAGTAIWANKIPVIPFTADLPWWERESQMHNRVRDTLGLSVGYLWHGYSTERSWFNVGLWPGYALDELHRRWAVAAEREGIDRFDIDRFDIDSEDNMKHRHRLEYEVVEWVLDDIVHGNRMHWWDPVRYEPSRDDD